MSPVKAEAQEDITYLTLVLTISAETMVMVALGVSI